MRMSKQEQRDEYKETEGDPFIKGKLRQIRTQRARKRMMAAVPKASVVITNPTHFAVALQYEMASAGAPRVVAKGADLIAARIRELARQHNVPVVENPPVARALYAAVEIDQEIPPEHYKAVAEIISYVLRLKGKLAGTQAAARTARQSR
jgi:flagellar biosynthetic protein FlhB